MDRKKKTHELNLMYDYKSRAFMQLIPSLISIMLKNVTTKLETLTRMGYLINRVLMGVCPCAIFSNGSGMAKLHK